MSTSVFLPRLPTSLALLVLVCLTFSDGQIAYAEQTPTLGYTHQAKTPRPALHRRAFLRQGAWILALGSALNGVLTFADTPTQIQTPPRQTAATRDLNTDATKKSASWRVSTDDGVMFDTQFAGARASNLRQLGTGRFAMTIRPEAQRINASPWYAFRISQPIATKGRKTIDVTLHYDGLRATHGKPMGHRYDPYISRDGVSWHPLAPKLLHHNKKERTATLRLAVPKVGDLWVAARPIFDSAAVNAWCERIAQQPNVTYEKIGTSAEGRAIHGLTIGATDPVTQAVFLCRQHPTETNAQAGLCEIIDYLSQPEISEKLVAMRSRITVFPLINPDGVDHGHFRNNLANVDLNRDWHRLTQPETRAIMNACVRLQEQSPIHLMVDIHETYRPRGYIDADDPRIGDLLIRTNARLNNQPKDKRVDVPSWTIAQPVPGTARSVFRQNFGSAATTFEFGQRQSANEVRDVAIALGDAVVEWLKKAPSDRPSHSIAANEANP